MIYLSKIFLVPVVNVVVVVCDFADEFERRYYSCYFRTNASFRDRCIPFFQHLIPSTKLICEGLIQFKALFPSEGKGQDDDDDEYNFSPRH